MPQLDKSAPNNLALFHGEIRATDGSSVGDSVREQDGEISLFFDSPILETTYVIRNHQQSDPSRYRVIDKSKKMAEPQIGIATTDGMSTSVKFQMLPQSGAFIVLEPLI